jgi:hypothetical protein
MSTLVPEGSSSPSPGALIWTSGASLSGTASKGWPQVSLEADAGVPSHHGPQVP